MDSLVTAFKLFITFSMRKIFPVSGCQLSVGLKSLICSLWRRKCILGANWSQGAIISWQMSSKYTLIWSDNGCPTFVLSTSGRFESEEEILSYHFLNEMLSNLSKVNKVQMSLQGVKSYPFLFGHKASFWSLESDFWLWFLKWKCVRYILTWPRKEMYYCMSNHVQFRFLKNCRFQSWKVIFGYGLLSEKISNQSYLD